MEESRPNNCLGVVINFIFQYEEYGESFVDMLDGMFSLVLLDSRDNSFLVARDAIGITSLYIGWGLDGTASLLYNDD